MKALIIGIRGQDGSYLSEILLEKNYEVHGLVRRSAFLSSNIDNLDVDLHYGDLLDYHSVRRIIESVRPDEIYNFAALSNVPDSFNNPQLAIETNGNGFVNVLEAVKMLDPYIKIYQASTTELFGKTASPQNEETPMNPQSPYSIGKYVAHKSAELYRNAYGMYVVSGILGNHESPRRGYEFVTRKITSSVAKIYLGKQDKLELGNLTARRDWGYSKEYCMAMYNMMQLPESDTFVIGTGENHSIQDFVDAAFAYVGLNPSDYVVQNKNLFRPQDVHDLIVDASKAKRIFGFEPQVKFNDLVKIMIDNDLELERG